MKQAPLAFDAECNAGRIAECTARASDGVCELHDLHNMMPAKSKQSRRPKACVMHWTYLGDFFAFDGESLLDWQHILKRSAKVRNRFQNHSNLLPPSESKPKRSSSPVGCWCSSRSGARRDRAMRPRLDGLLHRRNRR